MNRTLMKTATYAVMHFTVAIIVAYALTRNWHIALAVGIAEPVVQTLAFAIHEKLWARSPTEGASASCGHGRALRALNRARAGRAAGAAIS